jgi:uncharacterized protein DUF4436
MAEREIDKEHAREPQPVADRDDGAPAGAQAAELPERKSDTWLGRRGRVAVLIGLLLTAMILYVGLVALLYRDTPHEELVFSTAGSEPPLDLTLNVLSLDPVREVINVRIEVTKPSENRWGPTLKLADVRDFVIHVDDRYLTFQIAVDGSGAKAALEIALNGSVGSYPLDRYTGRLAISAKKKGSEAVQPIRLTAWPLVANWNVDVRRSGQASDAAAGVDLDIRVNRPASLIVMAFAFYAAMALIGLSGLTIGTLVFLGVRPVEATMMGALGAMIFSIPALRGIMPGAPPLGVHADALILVWVQLAVILGLTLFVVTWVFSRR